MQNLFFALGSGLSLLGVAFGAFGAHTLKSKLAPEMLETFEIAVRYQMYHSLGLLAAAWAVSQWQNQLTGCVGMVFFRWHPHLFGEPLRAESYGYPMAWRNYTYRRVSVYCRLGLPDHRCNPGRMKLMGRVYPRNRQARFPLLLWCDRQRYADSEYTVGDNIFNV